MHRKETEEIILKNLEAIRALGAEGIKRELAPYFYTYFKSIMADPVALTQYMRDCQRIFDICNAEGKDVLDVGCGFGLLSIHLAYMGAGRVYATDLNEEKIAVLNKILPRLKPPLHNIEVKLADALRLDFADGWFDVVMVNNVISHVRDRDAFLLQVNRVLRPGGILYIHDSNNKLNLLPPRRIRRSRRMLEYGPIDETQLRGTDTAIPWVILRERMIAQRYPALESARLKHLARETAGMAGEEIYRAVAEYLKEGKIRQKPDFKFRNPETGEYQEYPFHPYGLASQLKEFGFQGKVLRPHYSVADRSILIKLAAQLITLLHPLSLLVAPGFTVVAKKVSNVVPLREPKVKTILAPTKYGA